MSVRVSAHLVYITSLVTLHSNAAYSTANATFYSNFITNQANHLNAE